MFVIKLSGCGFESCCGQLKSDSKRRIRWNKYQPKVSTEIQNQYLDILIDPSFQGVNRLFVLLFENEEDRKLNTKYYLSSVKIKECNIIIDGKFFFDRLVNNSLKIYDDIRKIAIGQGDDHTTGCLLDYNYFKTWYNMIYYNRFK